MIINRKFEIVKREKYLIIFVIVMLILFTVSVISFVVTPLTGDLTVFIAAARQSQYSESAFQGALTTWELKGMGNRTLIYFLYRLTLVFTPYGDSKFPIVFSIFYVCLVCLVLVIISFLLKNKFNNFKTLKMLIVFLVLGCSIFYSYCCNQMQAEMSGIVILLLALAIYFYNNNILNKLFAGFLFGLIFYFKSALLVMGISFLAAIFLFNYRTVSKTFYKDVMLYLIGAGISVFGGLILLWNIYPQEIYDMLDASAFQSTLLNTDLSNINFNIIIIELLRGIFEACLRIPIIFAGICAGIFLLFKFIRDSKQYIKAMFVLFLWSSPIIFIVLSNHYFAYHFYTFTFPAIISLALTVLEKKEQEQSCCKMIIYGSGCAILLFTICKIPFVYQNINNQKVFFSIFCILLIILIILLIKNRKQMSYFFNIGIVVFIIFNCLYFTSLFSESVIYYRTLYKEYDSIKCKDDLSVFEGEKVLYLDGGIGAYYLGAESYLRYYFPLPLQRLVQGTAAANISCYTDSFEKMMKYQGKYITCDKEWFFSRNEYKEFQEKLKLEYTLLDRTIIWVPVTWDLFNYKNASGLSQVSLLQRK